MPFSRKLLFIIIFLAFFPFREAYGGGGIASISPLGASENVMIDVTGAGFDPAPSKNRVVFTHDGVSRENPAVTISAASQKDGALRRLGVPVPEGLPAGTAIVKVINTATGEVIEGGSIEVIGITIKDVTSARPGSSVDIRITGTPNARFVSNGTVTAFGEGVKVNYETVESGTSVVANITVAPDARAGARSIGLMTASQVAVLLRAFTVKEGPVRFAGSDDPLGLDATEPLSGIFAPFDDKDDKLADGASGADSSGPAQNIVRPAEPKIEPADVRKVADAVKTEEIKTDKAAEGVIATPQVIADQQADTKKDAPKPEKEASAAPHDEKAGEVNIVALVSEEPYVISLKNGSDVSIAAPADAALTIPAPEECRADSVEKISAEPVDSPFIAADILLSGDTGPTAFDGMEPPTQGQDEERGVLRKAVVALLGPFILIGYLLSHLWKL